MSFATTCLITFHFISKLQNGLSTPSLNQFVLKCSLVHYQNACDFCPLPRIGSCKITKKLQHIYLSSLEKKFFAVLCLCYSCHCRHNWVKYEAHNILPLLDIPKRKYASPCVWYNYIGCPLDLSFNSSKPWPSMLPLSSHLGYWSCN